MPAKRLAIKPVWLELTARLHVASALNGAENQQAGGFAFLATNVESNWLKKRLVRAATARTIEGQKI
jgi:hypothetical protein